MTSKEALSDLSFLAIGDENHTIKCKEIIEKDLEVLEILKKSITHKENHKYVLNGKMKGQKFMTMNLYIIGDNDFKKVKEWLEYDN